MTEKKKRISLGTEQWFILPVLVLMLLLAAWGYRSYKSMVEAMDRSTTCQTAGRDMQEASDYLTNQARYFAMTGDPTYMNNYFTEANVTKRRNNALETLGNSFEGTEAYKDLLRSFSSSVVLMNTEYYSMRLVCEATGLDQSLWPSEVAGTELSEEDRSLSPAEMQEKAREILFDSDYSRMKETIDSSAKECTSELMNQTQELSQHYSFLFRTVYMVMILCLLFVTLLSSILWRGKHTLERYQKELEKAKDAAEASSAAKTRFLFNMSHDLRTPLNAVTGFSELLEKHRDDDEQFHHDLDGIKASGAYLLDIIDNVLDMADLENGKIVPEEIYVRPQEMEERIEAVFRSELDKKQLNYSFLRPTPMLPIYSDPALTSKIILNIMGNAVKYTPEGGSIRFTLEQIITGPGTCNMYITVSDTGIGMSKEFVAHAFDAFERARNSTQSGVDGTGLGLSIVKGIVDCMKGHISIESEPGAGTTVKISIPQRLAEAAEPAAALDAAPEEETAPSGAMPDLTGRRILVVEDNDINAEILMDILEETGAGLERAEDGQICVEMYEQAAPGYYDLILMDIQMPNLDGYGATKAIRAMADPEKAGIPIYAMTAQAFDEDRNKALASGMNGHLSKPVDIPTLMETLSTALNGE